MRWIVDMANISEKSYELALLELRKKNNPLLYNFRNRNSLKDNMAKKETTGKPRLELLKRTALEQMAFIRTFGIDKYQNDTDWRLNPVEDYAGAALRHIYKCLDGEKIDQESGYMHLAHAMVDLMLAIELAKD